MDLALNNLQMLICNKTQTNEQTYKHACVCMRVNMFQML